MCSCWSSIVLVERVLKPTIFGWDRVWLISVPVLCPKILNHDPVWTMGGLSMNPTSLIRSAVLDDIRLANCFLESVYAWTFFSLLPIKYISPVTSPSSSLKNDVGCHCRKSYDLFSKSYLLLTVLDRDRVWLMGGTSMNQISYLVIGILDCNGLYNTYHFTWSIAR